MCRRLETRWCIQQHNTIPLNDMEMMSQKKVGRTKKDGLVNSLWIEESYIHALENAKFFFDFFLLEKNPNNGN